MVCLAISQADFVYVVYVVANLLRCLLYVFFLVHYLLHVAALYTSFSMQLYHSSPYYPLVVSTSGLF